jgi:hypothetical protein
MRLWRVEVWPIVLGAGWLAAAPAIGADRSAIAIFRDWGAFREGSTGSPARCFAIAEPPPHTIAAGHGAFASVANWPDRRIRSQISIRLSRAADARMPVSLSIGTASFRLVARDRDAWAPDRRTDALIVSAMRSGSSMSVSGVGAGGIPFADAYRLRGAASAIDAAALACPPRG